MSHLGKTTFKHYVETECQRRLFWDVAEPDLNWMSPPRPLVPPTFDRREAARLGHDYEQRIYRALLRLPGTRAERAIDGAVLLRELTPSALEALYGEATQAPLLLLEHEWKAPQSFYSFLVDQPEDVPLPVEQPDGGLRPDILVVGAGEHAPWEVLPDGSLRRLPEAEAAARLALRLIDVKRTSEQSVGRTHFVELHYYAHALSHWLVENGLTERFYIPTAGHAILPWVPEGELAGLTLEDVLDDTMTVSLDWLDTRALFTRTREQLAALARERPYVPDEVPPRIQPGCGVCRYLNDCKTSLSNGSAEPGEWDLRLIPYTSPATADLLRDLEGLRTVRDVAEVMAIDPEQERYDPLYAERPLLRLKARALMRGDVLPAAPEHLGGQRQFTMAIPRYNDLSLFFDLETDPTHQVVFAAALRLEISCAPGAPFRDVHDAWWAGWRGLLQEDVPLSPRSSALKTALDPDFLAEQQLSEPTINALLREAAAALDVMDADGELEIIASDGDKPARLRWSWSYISDRVQPEAEFELCRSLLLSLHACISLCNAIEALVGVLWTWTDGEKEKIYKVTPSMAVFYWSAEQVAHVREMLERQVPRLNGDEHLRRRFRELLEWFGPAESSVTHFDQHRKIFDLRAFAETTWGLPHVINCTWHQLAASTGGQSANPRYWARHFNYMDYSVWQVALEEGNARKRLKALDAICTELERKLRALRGILFQLRSGDSDRLVMKRLVETRAMRQRSVEDGVHPIGRTWYLYARLNGTAEQLAADEVRLSYPSKGIGRLKAARAEALTLHPAPDGEKVHRIGFMLRGMSAGVRFKEGDRVLMLPESDRTGGYLRGAQVTLEEMRYEPESGSYACIGTTENPRLLEQIEVSLGSTGDEPIYLYPTAMDIWSGRLLGNQSSLLRRHNWRAGRSWLGWRASYLMRLQEPQVLSAPPSLDCHISELYLYAPKLLPTGELEGTLKTTAYPPPDPSQAEAIRRALGSTVTCLQGPPGTGKSQTLAALIDEHLSRSEGPQRILVTAFSYDAMLVLLQKLQEHRDASGEPTAAARVQKVFARSPHRELPLGGADDLEVVSKKMTLNGAPLSRTGKRLTDYLEPSFVLFANAHSLFHLGQPSTAKKWDYELLPNDFGFDLIVVDEASQMPSDQLLSSVLLVRDGQARLRFTAGEPDWSQRVPPRLLEAMEVAELPEELTRVVVVGDQHQLPPVQAVKPPAKLQKVLGSLFHYYLHGHGLPAWQLGVNYRSTDIIVDYTRSLGLYGDLAAYRKDHPWPALPPAPEGVAPWLAGVLDPSLDVHALIHERQGERATSELEAKLAAETVAGFYQQLGVSDAASERAFWTDRIGVVAPHNAQGRRIIQRIKGLLTGVTRLGEEELDRLLRGTVYSVEKFQGSDRTFIIASMGISARDQLMAEEEFIYGLNRFNVLSSRAKQKMLLLCSRTFLDHIPRDRDIMAQASRIRAYALDFCENHALIKVVNEGGDEEKLTWRWRGEVGLREPAPVEQPADDGRYQNPPQPPGLLQSPGRAYQADKSQGKGHMIAHNLQETARSIWESDSYYKLVLLAGEARTGKTRALQALAAETGWALLNLNLLLSERLLQVPTRQRAIRAQRLVEAILAENPGDGVILDNIELLFQPELELDPLRLLLSLTRNRGVVASWPGSYSDSTLTYAATGHVEHKSYLKPDCAIVSMPRE